MNEMSPSRNSGRTVQAAPTLEVIEAAPSRTSQNSAPVLPHIVTRSGGIPLVGGVARGRNALPGTKMPTTIGLTCDNSGGGAPATFILFDSFGAVAASLPGAYSNPTLTTGPSLTVLNNILQVSPIVFNGVNYRVTTGTAQQFSESLRYAHAEFDGSLDVEPLFPQQAIRNTQQNEKVLTIEQEIIIDGQSALLLTVGAGVVAVLDFFVQTQFNRLSS